MNKTTRKYHFQDERFVELDPFLKLLIFLAFDEVGSCHGLSRELNDRTDTTVRSILSGNAKNIRTEKINKVIRLIA